MLTSFNVSHAHDDDIHMMDVSSQFSSRISHALCVTWMNHSFMIPRMGWLGDGGEREKLVKSMRKLTHFHHWGKWGGRLVIKKDVLRLIFVAHFSLRLQHGVDITQVSLQISRLCVVASACARLKCDEMNVNKLLEISTCDMNLIHFLHIILISYHTLIFSQLTHSSTPSFSFYFMQSSEFTVSWRIVGLQTQNVCSDRLSAIYAKFEFKSPLSTLNHQFHSA